MDATPLIWQGIWLSTQVIFLGLQNYEPFIHLIEKRPYDIKLYILRRWFIE